MRFMVRLSMDSAAFDEPATELARILRDLAKRCEQGELLEPLVLRDLNGNSCGVAEIVE